MLDGAQGPAARWGLGYQVQVGEFFGAERLVPVRSAQELAHLHLVAEAPAGGRALRAVEHRLLLGGEAHRYLGAPAAAPFEPGAPTAGAPSPQASAGDQSTSSASPPPSTHPSA